MYRRTFRPKRRVIRRKGRYARRAVVGPRRRNYGRRRVSARRSLPMRRIKDAVSFKKRDKMLQVVSSDLSPSGTLSSGTLALGPTNGSYLFAWIPTYRGLGVTTANPGGVGIRAPATRQTTDVFFRMITEKMRITVSTKPWLWRRLCFTYKGDALVTSTGGSLENNVNWFHYYSTAAGYRRPWFGGQSNAAVFDGVRDILFKGTQNTDWQDIISAPPDGNRVRILSDRTITLRSGNQTVNVFEKRKVHMVNKTLRYADDEVGMDQGGFPLSTGGRAGCGDVYVIDVFKPAVSDTDDNYLFVDSEASVYWHEK